MVPLVSLHEQVVVLLPEVQHVSERPLGPPGSELVRLLLLLFSDGHHGPESPEGPDQLVVSIVGCHLNIGLDLGQSVYKGVVLESIEVVGLELLVVVSVGQSGESPVLVGVEVVERVLHHE